LRSASLLLLLLSLCACSSQRQPRLPPIPPSLVGATLSKAQVAEDVERLFGVIEKFHPNPYSLRTQADLTAARRRLLAGLTERVGRADLWMRLAPLVASLGDRTSLALPAEEATRRTASGERLFPFAVTPALLIGRSATASPLRTGDRIIDINGQAAADLLFRFTRFYSGNSPAARAAQMAPDFPELLLLNGIVAPFEIQYATDGAQRMAVVEGVAAARFNALKRLPRPPAGCLHVFQLPHSKLLASVPTKPGCN
jgi:hypothetical protein